MWTRSIRVPVFVVISFGAPWYSRLLRRFLRPRGVVQVRWSAVEFPECIPNHKEASLGVRAMSTDQTAFTGPSGRYVRDRRVNMLWDIYHLCSAPFRGFTPVYARVSNVRILQ